MERHDNAIVADVWSHLGTSGYFLAERLLDRDVKTAFSTACKTAAIRVTRPGAAVSIPKREEIHSA